jgi:proteasome assembly chaperone (PAC2) family protein
MCTVAETQGIFISPTTTRAVIPAFLKSVSSEVPMNALLTVGRPLAQ